MKNKVYWVDIVIFEDNTFALEAVYVDIVPQFATAFNEQKFKTEKQLNDFFGGAEVIYDCDKFNEYIMKKYNKPFRALILDNVTLTPEIKQCIDKKCNLAICGGYVNGIAF